MIKFGICFCQNGVMSQCVASSNTEQELCDFYSGSANAIRCMHRNENLNDHCWSPEAQNFGYHPPEEGTEYELEEEVDLVAMAVRAEKSCVDCILYTCAHIIHEQQMSQPRGGLTHDDLCNIAKNCGEYDDEASMNARINLSLRGINP